MTPVPIRPLTPDAIRRIGAGLFGDAAGWQSRMAESMGYDRSAVTRWLNGSVPMPRHACLLLLFMERYGVPTEADETLCKPASRRTAWPRKPQPCNPSNPGGDDDGERSDQKP